MQILEDPFEVEKLRLYLARRRKIKKFLETYASEYPEIFNCNTSRLWDELNSRKHIGFRESPMTFHKLLIVSGLIPDERVKVLNIACGRGDLEYVVFTKQGKYNLEWTGIDISRKSINICKDEFPEARFFRGDIRKLKFKNSTFDFAIAMEILEHLPPSDTFKALKEMKRILRPNGKLIITVPLNENLAEMIKMGENPNAHVRVYSPEVLKLELELGGFVTVKVSFLYAFSRFYWLKTWLVRYFLKDFRQPNAMVIVAVKK